MNNKLQITYGQYTSKGKKEVNQDFHDLNIPNDHLLKYKGIAVAIADGISSSDVSQIASKISVVSFLQDYYCTSESLSVKKSAQKVLMATNSWLYSQTKQSQHRYDKDKGYVCTFSAMIFKSTTAHIFHLGDSRIYRIRDKKLEILTDDHRLWISQNQSYLSRAMGMDSLLNIDYDSISMEKDDIFLLMTDGVYEHIKSEFIINTIEEHKDDYDAAAKLFVTKALENKSGDNLTIQLIRIDNLPNKEIKEINQQLKDKPLPPLLEARMTFDGYKIIRNLSSSSRSHVYLAVDEETDSSVVIKIPSIDLQNDKAYLERFMQEEWIARKINNAYVVKSYLQTRKRNYIYNVTEFIEGQTLTQWMIDNPKPTLDKTRGIIEQIAKGLFAFHKLEMVHQDIRPENILIDSTGSIKIIDFGATRVEGIADINSKLTQENLQGTALYSAPEYFIGKRGTNRSDIFSLGIIAYQMLSAKFPYGTKVARNTNEKAQKKLKYSSLLLNKNSKVPLWIDEALKKSVSINPNQRYEELSEFMHDLYHPNEKFLNRTKTPLIERDPVVFWQGITFILSIIIFILLIK